MTDKALLALIEGTYNTRFKRAWHDTVGGRMCFLATAWDIESAYGPIPTEQWDRVAQATAEGGLFTIGEGSEVETLMWLSYDEHKLVKATVKAEHERRIAANPDADPKTLRLSQEEADAIATELIGTHAYWDLDGQ